MTLEAGNSTTQMVNKLEMEFDAVEKKHLWPYLFHQIKGESMKNDFSTDEAKKLANRNLNRYRDVNPYDHSRVVLSKNEFNYINASYITVEDARRKYILTQGPLPNTIVHFWLMIWEQNSKAIIMLNKLIEKNQIKCSQYWPGSTNDSDVDNTAPEHGGNTLELPDVGLRVELMSQKKYSDYVVRNLRLTNTAERESRDILQYHYVTWPDFGVPPSPLAFLKFLRDIRQSGAFDSTYGPPIVHCSAGIGRSGTFCLVDSCLILLNEKGVENVNITQILLKMRNCRMGLIQTADQLRFSYVALLQGLKVDWNAVHEDGLPAENYSYETNNGDSEEDTPPPLPPPRNSSLDKPLPGSPSQSSLSCDSSVPDDIVEETTSEIDSANDSSDDLEDDSDVNVDVDVDDDGDDNNYDKENMISSSSGVEVVSDDLSSLAESSSFIDVPPPPPPPSSQQQQQQQQQLQLKKRKHVDTENKSKKMSEKLREMKKKQGDAEKWKKQRSILVNLTLGASVVAVSGVIIAYFWYGKNA